MPELPEVETVCRGLAPKLEGARIARLLQRRKDLRLALPARFAARVEGRRVVKLERRAKYILAHLDDGTVWLMHLGMSGRMMVLSHNEAAVTPFDAHDHVVFETDSGWQIRFRDPRRFGLMLLLKPGEAATHKLLRGLGPEPLEEAFTGAVLAGALQGKRTPIKSALLDQRVVAGIGNIYACEGLFLAGLKPGRLAATVQGEKAAKLVAGLKAVLNRAIADGGSSLRDHVQPDGELGYFQTRFSVYDREGQACPGCGRKVKRMVQAGRSTFYCAHCQR
ncbi:MAG: bifunctional DNA-formamidopyrimidine glycosylase/DNA-(apurinic or apyrimidinic site) lyase [Reyranellaceae bacterium]